MTTINAKAGELTDLIRKLSLPYKGEALFNPIRLVFEDGAIGCVSQSQGKTAVLRAKATNLGVDGDQDVTVDSNELLKFLGLYSGNEDISVDFSDKAIVIKGERKESTIYPEALNPTIPTALPQLNEDGIGTFKGGAETATTIVTIEASQIAGLVNDASTIDVVDFPLSFSPDGSSAGLGSHEAKHNRITTFLDCEVEGDSAKTTIGLDLAHLFTNVRGKVQIHTKDEYPLLVVQDDADGKFVWFLAPRMT